ncbi:MAG: hypothetical protein KatS3mg065_0995 [Chloroflexota bacterium]|nr:MAG: hypothetical protein KatS3mg065_0995 [Chloroflexota bacterium]
MIVAARPVVRRVEPGEPVGIFRRLRRRIGRPDRLAPPAPAEPPVDRQGDREVRLVVRVRLTTEDEAERECAHSVTVDLEADGVVDGEF